MNINEIVTRLNGAFLRKAEMHGDFYKVYTDIFERLAIFSLAEEVEVLELFGDMGG